MAGPLLAVLTLYCAILMVRGLAVKGRCYEYPFFAAGIYAIFVIPQLPGLIDDPFLPADGLTKTLVMLILCLAACDLGWRHGTSMAAFRDQAFDERRLLFGAGVLVFVGSIFYHLFGLLPDEERLRSMLTGRAVMYLFFAKLLGYGLAVAAYCMARRFSWLAFWIVAYASLFYLERILLAGRRAETAEFALMFALAFWFHRRISVPRTLAVVGLAIGFLAMFATHEYRQATWYDEDSKLADLATIDLSAKWNELMNDGGPEMRNAVMTIAQADATGGYTLGAETWNVLAFAYVPAQVVGEATKQALMLDIQDRFPVGYQVQPGTTSSGMSDAFAAYWYFGCLKFYLIALLLAKIYKSAMAGNTVMGIVYILSAVPSILVITHFTDELIVAWVHMFVFLTPVFLFARIRLADVGAYRWAAG